MSAPEGLEVGSVRERDLDLDENVAGTWLRPRHFLEPQVAGAVEPKRSHGVKTTLRARPLAIELETLREAREREHGRSRKLELREQRGGLAHRGRSRRAGADERELPPIDLVEVDRARVREHEHRPTRRERVERRRGRAEDERVDRPVRRASVALGAEVACEDLVAAPAQHLREQPPDEALPDHEDATRAERARRREGRKRAARRRCRSRRRSRPAARRPRSAATSSASPPGTIVGAAK